MEVKIYGLVEEGNASIEYVVVIPRYKGQWVLSKHSKRSTFEFAGGHCEKGETIEESASRELFEETGAASFELYPVSIYSVKDENGNESFGKLYFAEVQSFDKLPDFEMEKIVFMDSIPQNLTYPEIYPTLLDQVHMYLESGYIKESIK